MNTETLAPGRVTMFEPATSANELVEHQPRATVPRAVTAVTATPGDLLRIAIDQGADLDRLERLMNLQTEWERREAEKAFNLDFAAFKAEPMDIFKRKQVGYKTKEGDFVGYMHAELSDVTDVVGPAMAKHGLSYSWDIKQDKLITVTCIVKHRLGHTAQVVMEAAPDTSGKKNAIQQVASTVSYLERYTLLAITGMSTKGMDDDGASSGPRDGERTQTDDEVAYLQTWQDAAMKGEAALRKHYDANVPTEEFWNANGRALRAAAKQADMRATRSAA